MTSFNKQKGNKHKKTKDGKFSSKKIKHDSQAESARAVFGLEDQERDQNT